ncbi:hypothetical protein LSTR_LSTR014115 [Laodelphax striatellus]|uniref:Uncharacterized protein n=1 Tax=Laodelphax striatellus TaxID=195883 RepID=A0A482WUP1_LAOST|nr:hypothetical protein LSTR_LSTR014115 [Laodelphax striatellus]
MWATSIWCDASMVDATVQDCRHAQRNSSAYRYHKVGAESAGAVSLYISDARSPPSEYCTAVAHADDFSDPEHNWEPDGRLGRALACPATEAALRGTAPSPGTPSSLIPRVVPEGNSDYVLKRSIRDVNTTPSRHSIISTPIGVAVSVRQRSVLCRWHQHSYGGQRRHCDNGDRQPPAQVALAAIPCEGNAQHRGGAPEVRPPTLATYPLDKLAAHCPPAANAPCVAARQRAGHEKPHSSCPRASPRPTETSLWPKRLASASTAFASS